jgi:hypothetical protein
LAAESVGIYEEWNGNAHTDRGKEFEPEAVAWYEFDRDVDTQQVGFVWKDDASGGLRVQSHHELGLTITFYVRDVINDDQLGLVRDLCLAAYTQLVMNNTVNYDEAQDAVDKRIGGYRG